MALLSGVPSGLGHQLLPATGWRLFILLVAEVCKRLRGSMRMVQYLIFLEYVKAKKGVARAL